ncbi:MAG TPA: DUF1573 domain-containing protein [Planctomycetaceae bacterium]|nr:DUF1573 domain-containing protein [Planctomycetaceae bacterium]
MQKAKFTIVLGSLVGVAVLSGAIWLGRYAPWVQKPKPTDSVISRRTRTLQEMEDLRAGREPRDSVGIASDPTIDRRPPIAEKPPFPKAAIEERVYRFGTMEVYEERKHKFRIENRGQGPLFIARGPTQCKCTISSLSKGEIPPGGFAEVELRWKPLEFGSFVKTAMIWTNDPQTPEFDFTIVGQVLQKVEVLPLSWNAGEITEDHDGTAVAKIGSPLDANLKIATVETANPNLKITYKPLGKPELTRAGWSAGYEFTATVGKGIPWGRFRSKARIRTTSDPDHPIDVDVAAVRSGDIRFLPPVAIVGGGTWSSTKTLLNLGVFQHEQGSKIALPALVAAMKGNFQVLGVESAVSFLKISVEPDPKIGSSERQGVRIVVEVPPGSPPLTRPVWAPVRVTLKTNHPTLSEIGFDLAFVSR